MIMTPTNTGSAIAGVGVWALIWSAFLKVDKIPLFKHLIPKERMITWMMENKSLTLILTEAINFGVHGISNPNGAIFALGGTIVNAFMIFVGIPYRQHKSHKDKAQYLARSASA